MSDVQEPDTRAGERLPTITVVIPAYNAGAFLSEQLESLCLQDYRGEWNVLVVNNRSTDDTVQVARTFADRLNLEVIDAPAKPSAGYARNVGIEAATGDFIVFVDGDDVSGSGLLSAYASGSRDFRIMGGQLDDFLLNDPAVASWRYSLTSNGLPIALGRFPFILSGNVAIRRDVFREIGTFDETLRYFGEDTDLGIRANLAGIAIGWVPDAVVHYRHRDSLRTLVRQQFIFGRGSVVIFDRYRSVAVPRRQVRTSVSQTFRVARGFHGLFRGRRRQGQWLSFASYVAGQFVQSVTMRVWYVG